MNNTLNIVNTGHTQAIDPGTNISPVSSATAQTGAFPPGKEIFFDSIQKIYSGSNQGEAKKGTDSSGNELPVFDHSSVVPAKNSRSGHPSSGIKDSLDTVLYDQSQMHILQQDAGNSRAADSLKINITGTDNPLPSRLVQEHYTGAVSSDKRTSQILAGKLTGSQIYPGESYTQNAKTQLTESDGLLTDRIRYSPNQIAQALKSDVVETEITIDHDQVTQKPGKNSMVGIHQPAFDSELITEKIAGASKTNYQRDIDNKTTDNTKRIRAYSIPGQSCQPDTTVIDAGRSEITDKPHPLIQLDDTISLAADSNSQLSPDRRTPDGIEPIKAVRENVVVKSYEELLNDTKSPDSTSEKQNLPDHTEYSLKGDRDRVQIDKIKPTIVFNESTNSGKENTMTRQFMEQSALNVEKTDVNTEKMHLVYELERNVDLSRPHTTRLSTMPDSQETYNRASENLIVQKSDLVSEQHDLNKGKSQLLPDIHHQQNLPNIPESLSSRVSQEPGVTIVKGDALISSSLSNNPLTVPQGEITEAFGKPVWSQGMAKQILWMINQNVSSAEIRLNPANLGPIEVLIDMNEDEVSVSLTSRHAVVREAMEQALPKLREMFDENGINLTDADISKHSLSEQREQSNDDKNNFLNSHRETITVADHIEQESQQVISSTNMVDYYI